MDEQSPNQLTERQVFARTLWRAFSNTFWYSVAAFVIVLTTKLWLPLAVALAVLYLIIIGIDVIWVLIGVIRAGRNALGKEPWTVLASVVRLLDTGAGILLGCYLYWRIFYIAY